MEQDQIKLLHKLAKELKAQTKDRRSVVASLQSAKILTKNENFTSHLKHLEKVFTLTD